MPLAQFRLLNWKNGQLLPEKKLYAPNINKSNNSDSSSDSSSDDNCSTLKGTKIRGKQDDTLNFKLSGRWVNYVEGMAKQVLKIT